MVDRIKRLEELFRSEITSYLARNMGQAGLLTITGVRISPDLERAQVFYSVLGTPNEKEITARSLVGMAYELRRYLGKLRIKRIPLIVFEYDDTPEKAARIENIFTRIKSEEGGSDEKKSA